MEQKLSEGFLKIQKKYKLPEFSILDHEFDFCDEESRNLLKDVRKRIAEVLEGYAKILEEVMHPESTISGLYESKSLDEKTKDMIFDVYKELMKLLRYALEVSLLNTEEHDAEFINKSYEGWMKLKKDMLPVVRVLKESWNQNFEEKQKLGYMG